MKKASAGQRATTRALTRSRCIGRSCVVPRRRSTTSAARACSTCSTRSSRPLTLVVAPAGTGKTSLVAGWMAESSTPTAWLSLDDTDRDGVQFWSARDRRPGDAGAGVRRPRAGRCCDVRAAEPTRSTSCSPTWRPRTDRRPCSSSTTSTSWTTMTSCVESVSRFVRNQPALAPPRPDVAAGAEAADRSDEVARPARRDPLRRVAVLTGRGGRADDPAVSGAVRGTHRGGRANAPTAGRRACSWRPSPRARVEPQTPAPGPGHDDDVLVQDYVLHEVLANEAPEVIDVLSAAAVVPRINPSLAHALTDRPDAGELLRTAEARGLFLTRRGVGRVVRAARAGPGRADRRSGEPRHRAG